MKKRICDHNVSSPTSSLGDVYGFTMNNEIDDQFIETGRVSVFNGYRACYGCGSVFHMGKKVLDEYGAVAEIDGRPIEASGVWRIWTLWNSEATERNRRWTN